MRPSEKFMKIGSQRQDLRFDEITSMGKRPVENLNFQSASEYCCAKMLEKYAGWKGIDGVTFQIPVGRTVFDFRIGDVFLEYHPIFLHHECLTSSLKRISSAISRLPKQKKIDVLNAIVDELEAQYSKRRGQVLAAHSIYGCMELICVSHPEGFIEDVIKRFCQDRVLKTEDLLLEFRGLQRRFENKL